MLGYCPLTECNPGTLQAFELDITLWKDTLYITEVIGFVQDMNSIGRKPRLMLCACVILWPHSPIWLPILDTKHVRNLSMGAIWNVIKEIGLPWFRIWFKGHKGPKCIRTNDGSNPLFIHSFIHSSLIEWRNSCLSCSHKTQYCVQNVLPLLTFSSKSPVDSHALNPLNPKLNPICYLLAL